MSWMQFAAALEGCAAAFAWWCGVPRRLHKDVLGYVAVILNELRGLIATGGALAASIVTAWATGATTTMLLVVVAGSLLIGASRWRRTNGRSDPLMLLQAMGKRSAPLLGRDDLKRAAERLPRQLLQGLAEAPDTHEQLLMAYAWVVARTLRVGISGKLVAFRDVRAGAAAREALLVLIGADVMGRAEAIRKAYAESQDEA